MWSQSDLDWLAASYPDLHEVSPGIIEGELVFSMIRSNGRFIVNPPRKVVRDTSPPDYLFIEDLYKIRLTWLGTESFPTAHEIGGKLAETARRFSKSLLDMHQYEQSGALCLSSDMALEQAFQAGFKMVGVAGPTLL